MHARLCARRSRRGNYAVIFALSLTSLMALGALAIDLSFVRLTQSQAQDVADSASQAAILVLRRTGDPAQARAAAELAVARNQVGGETPSLEALTFGVWDNTTVPGSFAPTDVGPNAVEVEVGRVGGNAVPFFFGQLFAHSTVDVQRPSVSAMRALQVILVMDITGSWSRRNFANARAASLAFLDVMKTSYGDEDMIGMSIFTGRYAWEYSPLTTIAEEASGGVLSTAWARLAVASKSGTPRPYPSECSVNTSNNWVSPPGGCYPDMPREYTDEPGTDHTTGLRMAYNMFQANERAGDFRAMVVLTDGIPNGLSAGHGTIRRTTGYAETRWDEYQGPVPHTAYQIQTESNTLTQAMWDDLQVNTWVISFVQDGAFMATMPKGIGYYELTTSSAALVPIFEDIAHSLPMSIVQ